VQPIVVITDEVSTINSAWPQINQHTGLACKIIGARLFNLSSSFAHIIHMCRQQTWSHPILVIAVEEGNLHPLCPPHEYLREYTSRGKPKIPPADRIPMNPGHTATKTPPNNADQGFQAAHYAAECRGVVSSEMQHHPVAWREASRRWNNLWGPCSWFAEHKGQ